MTKKIELLSLLFYYIYKVEKLFIAEGVFSKPNEVSIGIGLKKVAIANNFYGEVLEYFINYRCFEGVEFISHG